MVADEAHELGIARYLAVVLIGLCGQQQRPHSRRSTAARCKTIGRPKHNQGSWNKVPHHLNGDVQRAYGGSDAPGFSHLCPPVLASARATSVCCQGDALEGRARRNTGLGSCRSRTTSLHNFMNLREAGGMAAVSSSHEFLPLAASSGHCQPMASSGAGSLLDTTVKIYRWALFGLTHDMSSLHGFEKGQPYLTALGLSNCRSSSPSFASGHRP
ncbi:hypothetical protein BS50DRAFT_60824 [Corynespora cassiicola Philippines]|uniref:Uncharacterized protein n=1 Tax=Corynespora cassiicola Philippines TaxID=1448308 RepID=A0A2T2NJJ6_CORCC|nr:hypothetical protein BS50DRAFT_60824 [Corynespora cassiicola Philippines]